MEKVRWTKSAKKLEKNPELRNILKKLPNFLGAKIQIIYVSVIFNFLVTLVTKDPNLSNISTVFEKQVKCPNIQAKNRQNNACKE